VSANTLSSGNSGAVALTLSQLFSTSNQTADAGLSPTLGVAAWNDETPDGKTSSSSAHAKGVLAVEPSSDSGFYLLHSVPLFPALNGSSYAPMPSSGAVYGQSLMCVSLSASGVDDAAKILLLDRVLLYTTKSAPSGGSASLSNFASLIGGTYDKTATAGSVVLQGTSGTPFTLFGKTGSWGLDIYASLIATTFSGPVVAETWIRGYEDGAFCPPTYPYATTDAADVTFAGHSWKETQDHSKWGVVTQGTTVVCIADLNRMTSQMKRGGGALCISNNALHTEFMKAIVDYKDSCSSTAAVAPKQNLRH
jgi:deoxyribonuclease-2